MISTYSKINHFLLKNVFIVYIKEMKFLYLVYFKITKKWKWYILEWVHWETKQNSNKQEQSKIL